MRQFFTIILALCLASSCTVSEIPTYKVSDSAVNFRTQSVQFSLKGMAEATRQLDIDVQLLGPTVDYDRQIDVEIDTEGLIDPAVEGVDYTFLGGKIDANSVKGVLSLVVNKLSIESPSRSIKLKIVPNEHFTVGFPKYQIIDVRWSEEYVRPVEAVWHYWFLYFSPYYSKAYHEVLVQVFGADIEKCVNRKSDVTEENGLIYQVPSWWLSASHLLYEYVKNYDAAHPDAPLRHSEDWMYYSGYTIGVENGVKNAEGLPTILGTLNVM